MAKEKEDRVKPWFSFDADTLGNGKIVALIDKYGMEGFGRFVALACFLRKQPHYEYSVTEKFAYVTIGQALMMSSRDAQSFIQDLISEFELLTLEGGIIFSESLKRRMEEYDAKREVARVSGAKGGRQRAQKNPPLEKTQGLLEKSQATLGKNPSDPSQISSHRIEENRREENKREEEKREETSTQDRVATLQCFVPDGTKKNEPGEEGAESVEPPPNEPPPPEKPGKQQFVPPSLEEVTAYWRTQLCTWQKCPNKGHPHMLHGDPEHFFDHFTSNGWKVSGKARMSDWQSAARNWSRNDKNFSKSPYLKVNAISTNAPKRSANFTTNPDRYRDTIAARGGIAQPEGS